MFKRDILKYSNIQEHLRILQILCIVEEGIKDFECLSDLQVHCSNNSVIISRNYEEHLSVEKISEENIQESVVVEDDSNEILEDSFKTDMLEELEEEVEMEVEETEEEAIIEVFHEIEMPESSKEEEEVYSEDITTSSTINRRKKYKYKVNTNESLTPEQVKWIQEQVKTSEVLIDGKKAFKCQICGTILSIPGTLKKHLRDCHVLKTQKERDDRNNRKEFKDEIKRSKMQVKTTAGIETIWKCERCKFNRIFKSEAGLKVHLRYNHIRDQVINNDFIAKCRVTVETENGTKNGWKCVDCQKILLSRDTLRYHMKLEHSDTVVAITEKQHQQIEDTTREIPNDSLIAILESKRKQTQEPSPCHCEECGLKFVNGTTKREKSLEIHQQLHVILKVVSQSYELPKCEDCKVMFSNNEELNNHLLTHDTSEVYPAKGMSFLVAKKFKDSIGTATVNDHNSWKCGHCVNTNFHEEIECIEHQMILHSKQLICPFDYLEFYGIRGIGQFCIHMKHKHPEMFPSLSISCSYCGEEFSNVFDKLTHMKNCDTKKFHCDHCQKTFFKKNQLIRHLKIISGDISFICDICGKKCASSMDRKLHYRKHTNEKSYQCSFPHCLKIFKTPAARSSHLEIHSNIEYECTDCKSIFKQRALLQRHLKKVCSKRVKSKK